LLHELNEAMKSQVHVRRLVQGDLNPVAPFQPSEDHVLFWAHQNVEHFLVAQQTLARQDRRKLEAMAEHRLGRSLDEYLDEAADLQTAWVRVMQNPRQLPPPELLSRSVQFFHQGQRLSKGLPCLEHLLGSHIVMELEQFHKELSGRETNLGEVRFWLREHEDGGLDTLCVGEAWLKEDGLVKKEEKATVARKQAQIKQNVEALGQEIRKLLLQHPPP